MNQNDSFSMDIGAIRYWRTGIKVGAYLVYLAGALFATITFSQHVSGQFPNDPLFRVMAYAGAWANMFSLALMPLAKEYWVSGRSMTMAAWLFWIAEVSIVVLNTLAAYGSEWAIWWTALSPASPIFVVAVWGLIWYLNPEAKAHQDQVNFYLEAQQDFQAKMRRAMRSQRVQDIMGEGAAQAAQQYAERSLNVAIDPTHRTKRNPAIREPEPVFINDNGKGVAVLEHKEPKRRIARE